MRATRLRTEHMRNPMGIDGKKPLLSWCCEAGIFQTAFQIIAKRDDIQIWDSGICRTDRMNCPMEAPLQSRDRITWKVRLWDENSEPGPWSEEASFELGITEPDQWQALWIDPETEELTGAWDDAINTKAKQAWSQGKKKEPFLPHRPASYLRKRFEAVPGKKNRLYITSKGIYNAFLRLGLID